MTMKIPELNHEQADKLLEIEHVANTFAFTALPPEHRAKCHYLTALEIADEQGLLTKEASLALKPDNWIEWQAMNDHGYAKGVNKIFRFDIYSINTDTIIHVINADDMTEVDLSTNQLRANYKYICRNWLDNYLKERECLEN